MSTLRAYDGAGPFDLNSAVKHNAILITGYLVGSPGGFSPINKTRVTNIRNKGLGFLPNWERAADFFRTASIADCKTAGVEAAKACRALGVPDDGSVAVAFSYDYEIASSAYPAMLNKLEACGKGMGDAYLPIAYGQYGFLQYLSQHGHPGPHWLMASTFQSTSQFSAAQVSQPFVGLVQSHDAAGNWLNTGVSGTDVNTVIHPETLSAWWPDNSEYGDSMNKQQFLALIKDSDVQDALGHAVMGYDQQGKKKQAWAYLQAAAQDSALSAQIQSLVQTAVQAGIKAAGTTSPTVADIAAGVEQGMKQAFADAGAS